MRSIVGWFSVLVVSAGCWTAKGAETPVEYGGIYPHLAMFSTDDECGTGAVVPWAGSLWVITYGPHHVVGSDAKFYQITPDLRQIVRPESVGGTPANRLIHRETNQLLIGPYVIDAAGNVRRVPIAEMPGRLTGAARHLTDPSNKVYVATMETGLYELDLKTLAVQTVIRENGKNDGVIADYLKKVGADFPKGWETAPVTHVPGYHAKGLASGFGRVFVSNNGEDSPAARKNPFVPSGVLAWWNQPGADWTTIRRCQYTEVTTPDGIYGNEHPETNPIWALGWDAKSVLLSVTTNGVDWMSYRLPKASHAYDGAHGWNTEWPRIREIGETNLLATMHGTFWSFPRDFSPARPNGLRPLSTYLKVIGDFCRWNDRIVFGCDDQAKSEFLGLRTLKRDAPKRTRSESNLWFVKPEDLTSFGPPSGEGWVWLNEEVKKGDVSDPFLAAGYEDRRFTFVDAAGKAVPYELQTEGDWVRVKALADAKGACAHFRYGPKRPPQVPSWRGVFDIHDAASGKTFRFPDLNGDKTILCREVATERDLLYVGGVFYEVPADNAGGFEALRPIALADEPVRSIESRLGLLYLNGRPMPLDALWQNGTAAAAYWLWEDFRAAEKRDFDAQFKTPPPGYGEVPFWWWTGEKLDKDRLRWQLEELHRAGIAGTQVNYSHERKFGWRTAEHEPRVFSDDWWKMFSFAAEVSAELGMGIGLSGYTLDWPGNDNLFKELGIVSPETEAQILHYENGVVKPIRHDRTLDPLNPESARRVIDRFLRPFWEKVPENARGALNYFFQDELRLAGDRHVWSDDFAAEFKRRKGYDVVPKLAALFTDIGPETARVRLDYNDVMVELTGERYFKPIYDWHASRGLIYACDPATRGYDPLEFGDYMRAMRWYTAPGFDTPGGKSDPVKCKMGSSIAHLYGRPRVWLEGYHSLGWQASTETIFDATAHNFVYGANLLNLHGLYYSTYGGWWEWAPPCYHFHQPYWALLPQTLKYFERLSWVLTRGRHVCDVAILVPQEPCVADFERARESVALSHRLVDKLAVNGTTDCDFIDAGSIGTTNEDYRVLILPKIFAMREETAKRVAAFERQGGLVIRAESEDDVKLPLVDPPDVIGNRGLKYHHRRTATEDIYYLVDWDGKTDVKFRTAGELAIYDLWTGEKTDRPIPGQPVLAVIDFSGLKDGENRMGAVLKGLAETRQAVAELAADCWTAELKPTLDNRWGDYRRPASPETITAEVRFMRDADGREVALEYGPQWLDGTNMVEYSRRYGVFGKPVFQNCHHGLNKRPGECFFILGDYDAGLTDVRASLDAPDVEKTFTTYVYADRETKALVHYEAEAPFLETWVSYRQREQVAPPELVSLEVGGRSVKPDAEIVLKPGYTPVVAKVRGLGRAIVYFTRDLCFMWRQLPELRSRLDFPDVLPIDPFGGTRRRGTFTANVSPLAVDAEVAVNGTLLKKEIKDGVLTVEVEYAPGYVGGNCFKGPIKVKTRSAAMKPGDWSWYEDLRCYSGGMVYRTTFDFAGPASANACYLLSLGQVGCAAEVRLNGGKPRAVMCSPWEVDVTDDLKVGENTVEITVYNTLNNHYQTIPTRYKVPTEQSPSGLLGPVRLERLHDASRGSF